jgi:hypothetical protein
VHKQDLRFWRSAAPDGRRQLDVCLLPPPLMVWVERWGAVIRDYVSVPDLVTRCGGWDMMGLAHVASGGRVEGWTTTNVLW